jgi:hypothetical protein
MLTRYNAAEKLLQHVKNVKLDDTKSNKWNLMIKIDKVLFEEEKELNEV